jgi:Fe-S cluster assembly iron-binding protein IscA
MLDVSPVAAEVLANLRTQQGLPLESMVRVGTSDECEELHISFVAQRADGDQLGEAHGLRYVVAADVADQLDDAVLDFRQASDHTGFVLRRS